MRRDTLSAEAIKDLVKITEKSTLTNMSALWGFLRDGDDYQKGFRNMKEISANMVLKKMDVEYPLTVLDHIFIAIEMPFEDIPLLMHGSGFVQEPIYQYRLEQGW